MPACLHFSLYLFICRCRLHLPPQFPLPLPLHIHLPPAASAPLSIFISTINTSAAHYIADVIFPFVAKCSSSMTFSSRSWQDDRWRAAASAHHNWWNTNEAQNNTAESARQSWWNTNGAWNNRAESAPHTVWSQTDSYRRSESERPSRGLPRCSAKEWPRCCGVHFLEAMGAIVDHNYQPITEAPQHYQDMAEDGGEIVRAWNRFDREQAAAMSHVDIASRGARNWQAAATKRLRHTRPKRRWRIRIAAAKATAAPAESAAAASAPTAVNAASPAGSSICSVAAVGSTEPQSGTAEEQPWEDEGSWISVDAVVPAPTGVEDNTAASARPELVPAPDAAASTPADANSITPTAAIRTTPTDTEEHLELVPHDDRLLKANNTAASLGIRARLIEGKYCWCRLHGKWLEPLAQPGQWLRLKPVRSYNWYKVRLGDMVFAQTQPGDYLNVHVVIDVEPYADDRGCGIIYTMGSNNDPSIMHGTCHEGHLLGRVVKVSW